MENKHECSFVDIFEDKSNNVLVLGIGNFLMGDEGVGVHIVQRMEKMKLPEHIDVLDGGTGGFFLMNVFDEYKKIIMIDATMDGKPAGTIKIIRPKFASDYPKTLSVHDVGLKDMIEALYLQEKLPDIYLMTISIEVIHPMKIGLSQAVESVVQRAIEKILDVGNKLYKELNQE